MTLLRLNEISIPSLSPQTLYSVEIEDGHFRSITPTGNSVQGHEQAMWPGFTETHTHLSLPANWDERRDDPRIIALQYLYYGITQIIDMFGFPMVAEEWEQGKKASAIPYPAVANCGYAITSMSDGNGLSGHGVEFPTPVYMVSVPTDLDMALEANDRRGATFLKVMFTDGTEQEDSPIRFTRIDKEILKYVAATVNEKGINAIVDCNTREETLYAYECGFRLFAHSVRDTKLSDEDWNGLEGARFISTLAGLRPMIMSRKDFETEYDKPGFDDTQDEYNKEFVRGIDQPFGITYGRQETRTAAIDNMRHNALAAHRRGCLLIGTDSGNLGALHGTSLLSEFSLLAEGDRELQQSLHHTASVEAWHYFHEMSGTTTTAHPLSVGQPATFNIFGSSSVLGELPEQTFIEGIPVDRDVLAKEITQLRHNQSKGNDQS